MTRPADAVVSAVAPPTIDLSTLRGWIPVSEQVPALDDRVLVARTRRFPRDEPPTHYVDVDYRSSRHSGVWYRTDGYERVTHWMPLPDSPEADRTSGDGATARTASPKEPT